MRKVIFTYLSILILFQGMFTYVDVFYEMEESVEVYADYKLHKTKYGDDFSSFFSKHFGEQKEAHKEQHKKEHEQHQHHEHPQKSLEEKTAFDYYYIKHNNQLQKSMVITSKTSNFYYKDLFSTFEKQKIFQPPRV